MSKIANIKADSYYAVVFTSELSEQTKDYGKMAEKMVELAGKQSGFLGMESARENGLGITVSYWQSIDAIKEWKNNAAHQVAQKQGREEWYQSFALRVCKVERDQFFNI